MITKETRLKTLKIASENTVNLYCSIETASILSPIRKKYGVKGEFIDLIGDIILGFYPKSALRRLLVSEVGVHDDIAEHIENDLKDFLAKIERASAAPEVPKAPEPAPVQAPERFTLRPENAPGTGVPRGETVGSQKPLTRDDVLRSFAPQTSPTPVPQPPASPTVPLPPNSARAAVQGYEAYRSQNGSAQ